MQLRRSLAVTAVTAFASSAALFTAPVVFAAESASPTPTATTSASGTPTPNASATTAKPSTSTSAAPSASPAVSTPSSAPVPAPVADERTAEEWAIEDEFPDGPKVALSGLPQRFVAGAPSRNFTATVTNTVGKDIVTAPFLGIENDKDNLDAQHVVLEFQNPKTKQWQRINLQLVVDEANPKDRGLIGFFGTVDGDGLPNEDAFYEVKKGKTLTIPMRISFTKDAPVGAGTALLAGLSFDRNEDVYFSFGGGYSFTITVPGAAADVGGVDYKPKPTNPKPMPSGHLAETGGSDSAATTYAIAGGVALIGGAGLLVVLRRRTARPGQPA